MAFDRLSSILDEIRKRYPSLSNRMKEAESLTRWEAAVGPAIAKHARAIRVQDGILWIEVDHPIWKSELHHRKRQILDRINGQLTETAPITDLLFLDPRPEPKSRFSGNKKPV